MCTLLKGRRSAEGDRVVHAFLVSRKKRRPIVYVVGRAGGVRYSWEGWVVLAVIAACAHDVLGGAYLTNQVQDVVFLGVKLLLYSSADGLHELYPAVVYLLFLGGVSETPSSNEGVVKHGQRVFVLLRLLFVSPSACRAMVLYVICVDARAGVRDVVVAGETWRRASRHAAAPLDAGQVACSGR